MPVFFHLNGKVGCTVTMAFTINHVLILNGAGTSLGGAVPQLLSLRSRAHMPQLLKLTRLEPVLHNKRSHRNEKPVHHNEEQPRSLQLEKACAQQRRPNAAKTKLIN